MEGKKFSVSIKTPIGAPSEYAAHALEAGRRKAGNELYNILWGYKLPAVVDIEEVSLPAPALASRYPDVYYPLENELRIEITVTPVQYHHVVMERIDWSAQQYMHLTGGTHRIKQALSKALAFFRLGGRYKPTTRK